MTTASSLRRQRAKRLRAANGDQPGLAAAPGNVLLAADRTGLPKDSVANVSQIVSVDRSVLGDRVGRLTAGDLGLVLAGIDLVLGRE
ncbi:MAG TPA: type II toxin-antitoxin system PemK/MazF family toxin [Solirubrobacteraceae bacterium]